MDQILNELVEKTAQIGSRSHLSKIVWHLLYIKSGVYTTGYNQNMEEIDFNLVRSNPELVTDFWKLMDEFSQVNKINKGTLSVYPDGRYESEFIWDEQADLDYRFQEVWQAVHFLGDNYFRQHLNTHYPDWESAVVSLKVKPEESITVSIQIKRGDLEEEQQFTLPESLEQGLLKMHYQTNEGDFKSLLNSWNTLELRLKSQSSFDYQQDASFL